MIVQYTTICDADHQRGETAKLDDRLFPPLEREMAESRRRSREFLKELNRNSRFPVRVELGVPDDG